jgi:hypothetical protein
MSSDTAMPRPAQPLDIKASDTERRQTVATLQAACVEGRLTLDEYGHRVEAALAARTRAQLGQLLADLPPDISPLPQLAGPAVRGGGGGVSRTVAVLSSAERNGFWRLAEDSSVLSVLGSCKLDLRSARIASSITTIDVTSVLGSVDVIVPTGVEVEMDATAVLGAHDMRLTPSTPALGAPVIRITGLVLLGSLTVRDAAALD